LLEAIVKKLQTNGYSVTSSLTGEHALKILTAQSTKPALIWLDFYLKDMNGMEFMLELNKLDNLKNIPVIVVSNSISDDLVTSMLDLGVKKYLLKANYALDDIISEMKEFIQ
jgi:CheY-like chemotaxis protein